MRIIFDEARYLQGDLKHTRNRELRLERLQGSLKMLMNEKEAKLNNTSLNSRAVVEKTGALQARIEELEAELAKQKVCLDFYHARSFFRLHLFTFDYHPVKLVSILLT